MCNLMEVKIDIINVYDLLKNPTKILISGENKFIKKITHHIDKRYPLCGVIITNDGDSYNDIDNMKKYTRYSRHLDKKIYIDDSYNIIDDYTPPQNQLDEIFKNIKNKKSFFIASYEDIKPYIHMDFNYIFVTSEKNIDIIHEKYINFLDLYSFTYIVKKILEDNEILILQNGLTGVKLLGAFKCS